MINAWVQELGPWAWWVLAAVLAGVEILVPGTFFIWFAAAAAVVGVVALVVDIGWQAEVLVFIVVAVASVLLGRRFYGRRGETEAEEVDLNDRARRQIGRTGLLDQPIAEGIGRVRLDDTLWRVEGPELPAGSRVKVVGVRAGRLVVEAAASA